MGSWMPFSGWSAPLSESPSPHLWGRITAPAGWTESAGSTRVCLLIDLAVSGILVLFLIAAKEILFRMFTTDPDVIRIGCNMLILIIPWYIVYVIIEVLAGALRGTGDVLVPMVITLTGVCVFRIIWLSVVMRVSPTIPAIIYSYPVTWTVSALAFIVYYIRKYRRSRIQ